MKTTAVSVSLLALGVASSYAIYAPELTRIETGKPWTVAASLRGFYDDNWACQPDWVDEKSDSFGFEARPFIGFNMPMESTYLGLSYLNSSRYCRRGPATTGILRTTSASSLTTPFHLATASK